MATKYYLEYKNPIQNVSNLLDSYNYSHKLLITYEYWYYGVYDAYYADLVERSIDWVIVDPIPDSTIGGLRLQDNITVLSGYSYAIVSDGGSIDVNVYYGSIGSTTKLLSSDLTVDGTEAFTTSFVTTNLNAGTWLSIHFGAIGRGTVSQITFTLLASAR